MLFFNKSRLFYPYFFLKKKNRFPSAVGKPKKRIKTHIRGRG